MPDTDYTFCVYSDTSQAFGPLLKENLDIVRLVFDFTCWLEDQEAANTQIGAVVYPMVSPEQPGVYPPWQVDYPLSDATPNPPPPDDFPLAVQSISVTNNATWVEVLLTAGTPSYTYVLSFVAQATTSGRRKQVDTLITVEVPLNPNMVSGATPAEGPPMTIHDDTVLPIGFDGRVYVKETTAPITVTLPLTPAVGQIVSPVDINGVAATHAITYQAASGDNIEGQPTFVSDINYDDLSFEFVGDHWIILTRRFACLG